MFAVRALVATAVAILGLLALGLLWYATNVLLVVFAGLLVAVGLAGLADWVSRRAGMRRSLALGLVVLAIAGLISLAVWGLADNVAEQTGVLIDTLPRAIENVRDT